jgi:hypothetical protein
MSPDYCKWWAEKFSGRRSLEQFFRTMRRRWLCDFAYKYWESKEQIAAAVDTYQIENGTLPTDMDYIRHSGIQVA